jgi:hypothetical protein
MSLNTRGGVMKKTIVIVLLGIVIGFIPGHGFAADWSAMTSVYRGGRS